MISTGTLEGSESATPGDRSVAADHAGIFASARWNAGRALASEYQR